MNLNKKKKVIRIVSIILMAIVAISGAYLGTMLSNPFGGGNEEGLEEVEYVNGKAIVTVLVVGLDKSECNSDVIMLMRFDERMNCLSAMSIPRDTYVNFGSNVGLINTAVVRQVKDEDGDIRAGGISLLAQKVTALTGVPINYYVVFKVGTFERLIDELGGIDYNVEQDMDYDDPAQDLYIHIKKGQQHLDGKNAEGLVRFRKYPQADLKRVQVQQDVLKEIINQKLTKEYISNIPDIYDILKEQLQSNFTVSEIIEFGKRGLGLDLNNINTTTLPTKGAGDAHLYPDTNEINKIIPEYFKEIPKDDE